MMHQRVRILFTIGLATLIGSVANANDLLQNGDFETGDLTGWVDAEPTIEGVTIGAPGVGAENGDFAAQIDRVDAVGELRQILPAEPGKEYRMNGYWLTESPLPGGPFGLFKIVFRDANGTDLVPAGVTDGFLLSDPNNFPGIESRPVLDLNSPANNWIFSSAGGIAPPDTVEVLFLALTINFGAGANPMWTDSLFGENFTDNPGVNLLANPGFDDGTLNGWVTLPASIGAPGIGAEDGMFASLLDNGGVSEINQFFPISPGDEVFMNGYYLTESVLPGSDRGLLKIIFRDAMGMDLEPASVSEGELIAPDFPGIEALPRLNADSNINEWIFAEAQGVAPAGAVEVGFLLLAIDFEGDVLNPMWFDSIEAGIVKDCLPGDVNMSGAVDLLDVQPFIDEVLSGTSTLCEADVDQNGSVNLLDVQPFIDLVLP